MQESIARYSLFAHYLNRVGYSEPDLIFSSENESKIAKLWREYNQDAYAIACTGITYGLACNLY